MILGMDFGTTNSGMAVYDGRTLRTLPLAPSRPDAAVDRSALYLTHDHRITTGQHAIDSYLAQNVGRPVKMERVRVGTIEVTAAEIGTYYRDVHILRDVLAPGRLFTSFKTFLSSTSYEGTIVGGLRYSLDDIVAAYLRVAKLRAERAIEQPLHAVVLGRPVTFARDPQADRLAQDRLIGAALRAGFDNVYLQYEPVAAALQYETSLQRERIVLVFDFGGGTLDVTVMRVGNSKTRAVLATGGLPVAGDVFDRHIVRNRLARLFGEGSMYGPPTRRVPVPGWIYDALADWQEIVSLQQPDNRAILDDIVATAERPQALRHLIELAARNYGLALYAAVEAAKRELSDVASTTIRFDAVTFSLREPLTQREFEHLIAEESRAVERLLVDVARTAGVTPNTIDAVVRTGGSSRIPLFVHMLERLFGAEKVRSLDAFSSVTAGLAVAAHRIEAGELDVPAFDRDPRAGTASGATPQSRVPSVDSRFLSSWVTAQEHAALATTSSAAVTWLAADYQIHASGLSGFEPEAATLARLHGPRPDAVRANQAVLSGLDDQLVLVTSAYRLLLTTPRQLQIFAESGLYLPQVHAFAHGEVLCALAPWEAVREYAQLAVVSSRGIVRVVDMDRVRSRLDRSIPFNLETPPESEPVAVTGLNRDQQLALVTTAGRAHRVLMPSVAARGFQAIKRVKDERLAGCVPMYETDHLIVVAANGTANVLSAGQVPPATGPNTPGKSVVRRSGVRSVVRVVPHVPLWALTSHSLRPAPPVQRFTADDAFAGRPFQLLSLDSDEEVLALLMPPDNTILSEESVRNVERR